MPGYRCHLVGGAVAAIGLYVVLGAPPISLGTAIEWMMCALAGALFPDVDIESKGRYHFYRIMLVLLPVLFFSKQYLFMVLLMIFLPLPLLVRHRRMFHDPIAIIGGTLCIGILLYGCFPTMGTVFAYDGVFFVIGAFSHLVLDRGLRRGIFR